MTTTSITSGYFTSYKLTVAAQNPFTIGSQATVGANAGTAALYTYGTSGITWNITNYGTVSGTNVNGIQVGSAASYSAGGVVTNQSGASITGGVYGIQIFNSANTSAYVLNEFDASIASSSTAAGGGVYLLNPGTVTNNGTISGGPSPTGVYGIRMVNGGTVNNTDANSATATIQGVKGVYMSAGTLAGSGAVYNSGSITGTGGDGIQFGAYGNPDTNGTVINTTGGTISGHFFGIQIFDTGIASVVNQNGAEILGTSAGGVYLGGSGTVVNHGLISSAAPATAGYGVRMQQGGEVINTDN